MCGCESFGENVWVWVWELEEGVYRYRVGIWEGGRVGFFFWGGVCVGGRVVGEVWACGGRGVGLYS